MKSKTEWKRFHERTPPPSNGGSPPLSGEAACKLANAVFKKLDHLHLPALRGTGCAGAEKVENAERVSVEKKASLFKGGEPAKLVEGFFVESFAWCKGFT